MLTFCLLFSYYLLYCNALPEGFEDQGVHRLNSVVDVGFATESDGTNLMFAITKDGELYTLKNFETDDDPNVQKVLSLDLVDIICDDGERGLGGILPHPDFAVNRYIYLFYTKKNLQYFNDENYACIHDKTKGPRNICSRFTVNDDLTIDKDSELELFRTAPLDGKIHNGGDMAFGVDGMLYVTVGDAGERGLAYAQRTNNLFGTILRLTESGDIPSDNPFTGDGTARCKDDGQTSEGTICREIFAYGLRNPFRFTMDPNSKNKVRFLINDVGGRRMEETNEGGTDYAGVNYGWPTAEGPCDYSSSTSCPVYDDFEDPIFWYEHNSEDQGAAVGIAIVPPGVTNWPSKYKSPSFFFLDFVFGIIYVAEEDQSNYCRNCILPKPGFDYTEFHKWPRPVALRFGPYKNTQALYYTAREGNINIRRVVYKSGANSAPSAKFSVDKEVVRVGEAVSFDASDSSDPDNDTLNYRWDFGDGSAMGSGLTVQHTYTESGSYTVALRVKDSQGLTDNYEMEISVGVLPTVEIVSPIEGTLFAVGDMFTLIGAGLDGQGNALDAANLHWEVRQHHGQHYHPFFSKEGVESVTIGPAPEPEDFLAATNSHLEIRLTGYDSIGLHSTVSLNIFPKTVWLDFDTAPTGLTLLLDEEELVMPQRILSWENHNLRIIAPDQGDYMFASWSNGAEQEDTINVPSPGSGVTKFMAIFYDTTRTETECFSGTSTVNVQGKGTINMEELQIGDLVEGSDAKFSRVYSFCRLLRDAESVYIQIQTSTAGVPLELSHDHILFLDGKKAVRAQDVKVGDRLYEGNEVLAVKNVKRKGLYAPMTDSGEILVSGVLASNYVALLDISPVHQQILAHALFAPQRLLCIYDFDKYCAKETYTDGLSNYAYYIVKAGFRLRKCNVWVQIGTVLLVTPIVLLFNIAESLFLNRALVHTICLVLIWNVRGRKKKLSK